jgi:uncharacterized protein YukE
MLSIKILHILKLFTLIPILASVSAKSYAKQDYDYFCSKFLSDHHIISQSLGDKIRKRSQLLGGIETDIIPRLKSMVKEKLRVNDAEKEIERLLAELESKTSQLENYTVNSYDESSVAHYNREVNVINKLRDKYLEAHSKYTELVSDWNSGLNEYQIEYADLSRNKSRLEGVAALLERAITEEEKAERETYLVRVMSCLSADFEKTSATK